MSRLAVDVGGVRLANPVICGAGEHVITEAGVRAAIDAGAGAVVVKSANESAAARRQLAHTGYTLLDSEFRELPWNFAPPPDASLLNRSGLFPGTLDEWIAQVARLVAAPGDAVIVPSVIPADYSVAPELCARVVAETGAHVIELNTGAPHGREAAAGAIALETATDPLAELVGSVVAAVDVPVWLKLTGQTDDVAALAASGWNAGAAAITVMGRHMGFVPDVDTQAPVLGTVGAYGGSWALPLTCRWLARIREDLGPHVPLLATNGARSGLDVVRFLLAGASAVQMNSAIFTGGFGVISTAVDELEQYLKGRGDTAAAIVGRAADRLGSYGEQPADEHAWERYVPPESRPNGEIALGGDTGDADR